MAKIAINGFGRIGRIFFRQAFGHKDMEIVAINDLGDIDNLAYLLQHDSVYRKYDKKIEVRNGNLVVDGHEIKFLQVKEANMLPWKELGIDIVLESTGVFESFEKAKVHLDAGAKKTVITAPSKDADGIFGQTVLIGINEGELKSWNLTSNGSCTTNATSPVMQIMTETIGVQKALLNTVHAYTATQSIVDGPVRGGKDFRRGRAAAQNMSPSTTGAAIALGRVVKEINGKFDGIAIRVPVVAGSLADITFLSKKKTTVEEVNSILERAAGSPRWSGVLKTTRDQVVSSDILGEPYGAIIDLNFTKVVDGDLVKILSWYDNEWGYVATLIKHLEGVAKLV